jgi:hypothetical protein
VLADKFDTSTLQEAVDAWIASRSNKHKAQQITNSTHPHHSKCWKFSLVSGDCYSLAIISLLMMKERPRKNSRQ